MRHILTSLLLILTVSVSFARIPADSVRVYFRVAHRQFDPAFADNREAMNRFIADINNADNKIDSIVIRAYASPDGNHVSNERLAIGRTQAIANYILRHTNVNPTIIRSIPEGVAWNELRSMVAENPNVPYKQNVLNILDKTPLWIFDSKGQIIGGRKKQLMDLKGGVPYNWLLQNIFPKLRNAVAVSLYISSDASPEKSDIVQIQIPDGRLELTEYTPLTVSDIDYDLYGIGNQGEIFKQARKRLREDSHFAIKTNLLYYAALMPNLEIEYKINPRWSVAANADVAWYSNINKYKAYELAVFSAEGRYWIRPKGLWNGLYVGVFGGGGLYDLENGGTGYRGEGGMAGASVGYMWAVSPRISLEAGLGVGYMYTRYKIYEPNGLHFIYQRTKGLNYFGPLKLKFSFVWRIPSNKYINNSNR